MATDDGGLTEDDYRIMMDIIVIVIAFTNLLFYWYKRKFENRCGWEPIFVTTVEPITYILDILFKSYNSDSPTGQPFPWMRYAEWLIITPVLLIQVTNLPLGLRNKRPQATLLAMVANQVMIVFGMSGALYSGSAKLVLFLIGCASGAVVFKVVFESMILAWQSYPDFARRGLLATAGVYFFSWMMFPILWLLGPEGYSVISIQVSIILHGVGDLWAKNVFTAMAWNLRWRVLGVRRELTPNLDLNSVGRAELFPDVDPERSDAPIDMLGPSRLGDRRRLQLPRSLGEELHDRVTEIAALAVRDVSKVMIDAISTTAASVVTERITRELHQRAFWLLLLEPDIVAQRALLARIAEVEKVHGVLFKVDTAPTIDAAVAFLERGTNGESPSERMYALVLANATMLDALKARARRVLRSTGSPERGDRRGRPEEAHPDQARLHRFRFGDLPDYDTMRRPGFQPDREASGEGVDPRGGPGRVGSTGVGGGTDGALTAAQRGRAIHPTRALLGLSMVVAYRHRPEGLRGHNSSFASIEVEGREDLRPRAVDPGTGGARGGGGRGGAGAGAGEGSAAAAAAGGREKPSHRGAADDADALDARKVTSDDGSADLSTPTSSKMTQEETLPTSPSFASADVTDLEPLDAEALGCDDVMAGVEDADSFDRAVSTLILRLKMKRAGEMRKAVWQEGMNAIRTVVKGGFSMFEERISKDMDDIILPESILEDAVGVVDHDHRPAPARGSPPLGPARRINAGSAAAQGSPPRSGASTPGGVLEGGPGPHSAPLSGRESAASSAASSFRSPELNADRTQRRPLGPVERTHHTAGVWSSSMMEGSLIDIPAASVPRWLAPPGEAPDGTSSAGNSWGRAYTAETDAGRLDGASIGPSMSHAVNVIVGDGEEVSVRVAEPSDSHLSIGRTIEAGVGSPNSVVRFAAGTLSGSHVRYEVGSRARGAASPMRWMTDASDFAGRVASETAVGTIGPSGTVQGTVVEEGTQVTTGYSMGTPSRDTVTRRLVHDSLGDHTPGSAHGMTAMYLREQRGDVATLSTTHPTTVYAVPTGDMTTIHASGVGLEEGTIPGPELEPVSEASHLQLPIRSTRVGKADSKDSTAPDGDRTSVGDHGSSTNSSTGARDTRIRVPRRGEDVGDREETPATSPGSLASRGMRDFTTQGSESTALAALGRSSVALDREGGTDDAARNGHRRADDLDHGMPAPPRPSLTNAVKDNGASHPGRGNDAGGGAVVVVVGSSAEDAGEESPTNIEAVRRPSLPRPIDLAVGAGSRRSAEDDQRSRRSSGTQSDHERRTTAGVADEED